MEIACLRRMRIVVSFSAALPRRKNLLGGGVQIAGTDKFMRADRQAPIWIVGLRRPMAGFKPFCPSSLRLTMDS
jgi:hypothetical protein